MHPKEWIQSQLRDTHQATRDLVTAQQSEMWTALPGIIVSVDLQAMTVEVQPSIQWAFTQPNLNRLYANLPVLPDVPIVFPAGGGYTLTFPINPGDECLLVFSSRSIDNWFQSGGIQKPYTEATHDINDGFALVGPYSQRKVIKNISDKTTQLRANDGLTYVDVDGPNQDIKLITPTSTVNVNGKANTVTITAPTKVTIDTPLLEVTGVMSVLNSKGGGNVAANIHGTLITDQDVIAINVSLYNHQHTNSGGSGTGGPPVR